MNIEDLLREAAPGANDLFLSALPDPKDCHYTVSRRFERKMQKLLKRQKSPVLYWVQRSVACFLLVVLLGGTSVLTFSAEARAAFFGWVREVYETYFVYSFDGGVQTDQENIIYQPTYIPEGYAEFSRFDSDHVTSIDYQHKEGLMVFFLYSADPSAVNVYVEQEGVETKSVAINGNMGDLYLDHREGQANSIVWTDEKGIIFVISGYLSADELISMAESVVAEK